MTPIFSDQWYRVKALRPQLRAHVRLHRHEYRDQVWYLFEDQSNARFHRFNTIAYRVIGLMDGSRTADEIWHEANSQLGDDAPVQDELIKLLGQLHQVDALQVDIAPDISELLKRGEQHATRNRLARIKNPLSIRLPLVDPDRFLTASLPYLRGFFSKTFFLLWLVSITIGCLLASNHWSQLQQAIYEQALMPMNLLLMALCYPGVKLLHELGHAFTAKLEGGEVHEMGILFMVFMPIPYVDASAATAFADRRKRMLVGAAGIMVELWLAALALFLWLNVEPGVVRSICLNVMLIGGISTLLFNGNPLLRFDGYYILVDAIGIPNLASRANRYIAYLIQHHLFGMEDATSPVTSEGEPIWLASYALASFAYRMVILVVISLFLLDTFFILGVLLVAWILLNQLALPLVKQAHFVFLGSALRRHRQRATLVVLTSTASIIAIVLLLPVNSLTRFEGVIWPPDNSQIVAGTNGFVVQLLAQPGAQVAAGEALIQLQNQALNGQMAVKQADLKALRAQRSAARATDRVAAKLIQDEIAAKSQEIASLRAEIGSLLITSPTDGVFLLPQAEDLPGQYVPQGGLLAYVTDAENATARLVVTQQDLDRISQRIDDIELRVVSQIDQVLTGKLVRQVPQATHHLPSKVLSVEGGGKFATKPGGSTPLTAQERLFEFEIELPLSNEQVMIGSRVFVRFDHGSETLATQWGRRLRQLFLRSFDS